jgi:hypothetical protein
LAGDENSDETMSAMWNDILYGTGSYKILRWFLAFILLVGIIWSGLMFKKVMDFSKPGKIDMPPPKDIAADDSYRLNSIISSFREAVLARSGSNSIAVAAAASAREPFVVTAKPVPAASEMPDVASAVEGVEISQRPEEVLPPFITVRAIMVLGSRSNAVLDIENEGEALLVKPGFTFGNGLGKVKSIKPDEIIIKWAGKDLDIPAGK